VSIEDTMRAMDGNGASPSERLEDLCFAQILAWTSFRASQGEPAEVRMPLSEAAEEADRRLADYLGVYDGDMIHAANKLVNAIADAEERGRREAFRGVAAGSLFVAGQWSVRDALLRQRDCPVTASEARMLMSATRRIATAAIEALYECTPWKASK